MNHYLEIIGGFALGAASCLVLRFLWRARKEDKQLAEMAAADKAKRLEAWSLRYADLEAGHEVGAGIFPSPFRVVEPIACLDCGSLAINETAMSYGISCMCCNCERLFEHPYDNDPGMHMRRIVTGEPKPEGRK